jgi:hypothetical protein
MSVIQTNICIYAATKGAPIEQLVPHLTTRPLFFENLCDLLVHLRSPDTAEDIAVLAPADREELAALRIHRRLQDRRLVLILPDAAEATLSLAHLLGPRYLCHADDVGTDLAPVLNKMAAKSRLQPKSVQPASIQAATEGAVG